MRKLYLTSNAYWETTVCVFLPMVYMEIWVAASEMDRSYKRGVGKTFESP